MCYGAHLHKTRAGGLTLPTGEVIWIDCPTCGPQPPRATPKEIRKPPFWHRPGQHLEDMDWIRQTVYVARIDWDRVKVPKRGGGEKWTSVPRAACAKCGVESRGRAIQMKPAGSKAEECNGACLGGRYSCSCHCGGRCHGAGVCRCNEAAAAA